MTTAEDATEAIPLRVRLRQVRPWLPARWPLAAVSLLSLVSGLIEALVVTVIAATAGVLAGGDDVIEVGLGPVDIDATINTALWVGVGATVLMVLLRLINGWILADLGRRVLTGSRMRLLDSYLSAPYEMQADSVQAELHELIIDRAFWLTHVVMLFAAALGATFGFLSMVGVAILLAPVIALSLVVISAVLVVVFLPLFRRTHTAGRIHMQSQVDVGIIVGDTAGLLAETHVFDAREGLLERARRPVDESGFAFRTAAFVSQAGSVGYIGAIFGLLLVGLLVVVHVDVGDPATLGAIALLMLRSLRQSQTAQTSLHQAVEVFPRVTAISNMIERLNAAQITAGDRGIERIDAVRFERVSYTYGDTADGVHDVDVDLRRGDLIGVVGPSGAGKSTFAELVMGLRDPSAGTIVVNGEPRTGLDRDQWFRRVAYVVQNPRLLEGTLADNVGFFRTSTAAEVDDAIERAALTPDVSRWPEGRDHPVGVGGQDLSGGQRQRVAIARALLGDPDLVVFDEPTSALDVESERVVRDTIAALGEEAIVLLISHRPSTLALCRRVFSFDAGRLTEIDPSEVTTLGALPVDEADR